ALPAILGDAVLGAQAAFNLRVARSARPGCFHCRRTPRLPCWAAVRMTYFSSRAADRRPRRRRWSRFRGGLPLVVQATIRFLASQHTAGALTDIPFPVHHEQRRTICEPVASRSIEVPRFDIDIADTIARPVCFFSHRGYAGVNAV